jgi:predicted metal-dependent phosphoesterase TrpH
MRVDLHIHTQASDGTWTPAQVVEHVRTTGIDMFAVADHDSISSVAACEKLARTDGMRFIRGVELSTMLNGRIYHILGYGFDPANEALRRLVHSNFSLRETTDLECLSMLQHDNFPVDFDDYESYENNPARGGWKGLNYLIDRGICANLDDFLYRLFGKHRPMPLPAFPPPEAVLTAIAGAGGVPIMAHPGAHWIRIEEEILETFRQAGIRGLECYTSYHDEAATQRFTEWCRRHNLLITGGSDCHGSFTPKRQLGVPRVEHTDLKLGELGS